MPKLRLSVRLSDVKTVLQLSQEALKGAGFFPGVEAIAGIPLKLIEYFETVSDNKNEMDLLASTLESLQGIVIEPIESARGRRHQYVPDLERRIRKLSEKLVEMESKLVPFANLGRLSSFRKRDEVSATLRAVNDGVDRAIRHFQLGGQITVETKIWEQAAEPTLRPAAARFDASEKQPCLPNTRSTLLATLRDHIHTSPRTFICLYGSPGTGKSAIAKSIATELHHHGLLAASYFFDKRGGDAGNISLATFVSTLIYQLARFNFDFHAALSRQLERDPLLADATADVRLRELLLEPLLTIQGPKRRWIIVLDALDECGDANHQRRLMSLLRSCARVDSHLVLFLTCRPEATITQAVEGWLLAPRLVIESMDNQEPADTTEDIRAFIDNRLHEMTAAEGWAYSPSSEDVTQLAVVCGGLFEVAAIRLRQLAEYCLSSPLRRAFADVLLTAKHSVSVFRPLYGVYVEILAAAYGSPRDPWRRAQMLSLHRALVGALLVLHQPLALGALAALVGVEHDEARKALELLSSVIAVPKQAQPIHFYHASFLEFLLSSPPSEQYHPTLDPSYFINSQHSHLALANRSLILMNRLLRRNILDLPKASIANDEVPELPQKLAQHVPEHLRYACLYWAEHLPTDGLATYGDLLVEWCNNKMIFYLELLSLLGELERAVPLLEIAEDCAKKVGNLAVTATLLHDGQRLVQMFFPRISESAHAVYFLAIPFMPRCRLHGQYSHLADAGVVLVRGRPPAWSAEIWGEIHPDMVRSIAVSSDGQHIASGCEDGLIRLLSTTTGKAKRLLRGHSEWVSSVVFSPDNGRIASGSRDCSVRLWSPTTGQLQRTLRGHTSWVNSVAISPDGAYVVSGSLDRSARIWSAVTGGQERVLEGHTRSVNSAAFSPDSARIATGSHDNSVRIWATATGEQERVLSWHADWVRSVAFSPDGARVVSGSNDYSVCIWSVATGEQERVLQGHNNDVKSVSFSSDGAHIVSGSHDRSVRVWCAVTGEQERIFQGHTDPVNSVAFSPDGELVVSGSDDRSVRLWSRSAITCTGELDPMVDQDHPLARSAFPIDQQKPSPIAKSGWLRVNGLTLWLPRYIQGRWWSRRDMVVIDPYDTPGRLAFIKLPTDTGSDRA